ncbi:MAG: hypothetical protein OIF32_05625, partial [Campylobacterales bacterium]|nr:hypothetical protein [Campylobacterales bacterium]
DKSSVKDMFESGPYVDQNSKIYVKNNKFYIYISDSKGGQKKIAVPVNNGSDIASVKLQKPGKNSIKYTGKNRKILGGMNVIWDRRAPSLKILHNGTSMFNRNKEYYFLPTSFKFKLKDSLSGENGVFYSINNNEINKLPHNGTLSFKEEGKYNLDLITVDNVGNLGKKLIKRFYIDITPPVTDLKPNASSFNCKEEIAIGDKIKININGKDNISGVNSSYYSLDDGKFKKYFSPLTYKDLKALSSGEHTIKYYSVDKVGNKEKAGTFTFNFDLTPPKTTYQLQEKFYQYDGVTYVAPSTKVILKSSDCAGVDHSTLYLADDIKRTYNVPITFKELASGMNKNINQKTTLYFHSVDKLGNVEKVNKTNIVLDFAPPKLKVKIKGRYIQEDGVYYVNQNAKFKIDGKDNLSGIKSIKYSIDDRDYTSYEAPLMLKEITDYDKFRFYFKGKDNVENATESNPIDVVVDRKSPKLFHHFSYNGLKVEGVEVNDGKNELNNYPTGVQLYVNTIDDVVGVNKVYVKINDQEREYTGKPITLNKSGDYRITIRVSDRVGNETSEKLTIRVVEMENGVIKNKIIH